MLFLSNVPLYFNNLQYGETLIDLKLNISHSLKLKISLVELHYIVFQIKLYKYRISAFFSIS